MRLKLGILLFAAFIMIGCAHEPKPDHYFLDGYPQLIFRTVEGDVVPTRFFIRRSSENGAHFYTILDASLRLTTRKDGKPYSGYIRTYDHSSYNIEAIFEDGTIKRLRFWHPNRVLGMDEDFNTSIGTVWNLDGGRSITWNSKERILFNPATKKPREIHEDSLSTYFDNNGEITYYTQRGDSMNYSYFANGNPRFFTPNTTRGNGQVKRWHSNGQLRAVGQYQNWNQVGTWVEYDSSGVEINREEFN